MELQLFYLLKYLPVSLVLLLLLLKWMPNQPRGQPSCWKKNLVCFLLLNSSLKGSKKGKSERRFDIIPSASTKTENLTTNSYDVVLHEIFGFIASSEGCALSVGHANHAYRNSAGKCIPNRAASLFCLTSISPDVCPQWRFSNFPGTRRIQPLRNTQNDFVPRMWAW